MLYWMRRDDENVEGIVVIFGWVSVHEKHLRDYVDLYASLGWNSLVCRADFLMAFHPEKATSVAFFILTELVEELKIKTCPVIFAALSGGSKACMYKVLQVIEGTCELHLHPDECQLVRSCVSGHIFDSSPIDFTSDLVSQFALHPTITKMPGASKLVSWVAKGVSLGMDSLFLTRFESQRNEYWQTLYSSVCLGAPYLILCSENDDLAPRHIIHPFAQRLQNLGGDVKLVKWDCSPHVGHYKHYPIQYQVAVTCLLEKAAVVYSQKIRRLEIERTGMGGMHDDMSELFCNLQKAAVDSSQSLRKVPFESSEQLLASSSSYENDSGSPNDEQKDRSMHLLNPPSINAHSVLGQVLFDACVPKNIEGWDIKFTSSLNGQPVATARRNSPSRNGYHMLVKRKCYLGVNCEKQSNATLSFPFEFPVAGRLKNAEFVVEEKACAPSGQLLMQLIYFFNFKFKLIWT